MFDNYSCDNQMSIFDFLRENFKIKNKIRLIELFGGIGSQAMALDELDADFEHYRLIEFDEKPVKSYNAIHGTDFKTMDITKVKGVDLEIVDVERFTYLLTYSFPCQDLSVAGKDKGMTKGSGTRSGLLWEVERLLNEVDNLPQVLVMENVKQVKSDKNIEDFYKWQSFLERKGYCNYVSVLNAKDYGVPQNRERCFMVSILGNYNYKFPNKIPLTKTAFDYLENDYDKKLLLTDSFRKTMLENEYSIDKYKKDTYEVANGNYKKDFIADYRYDEGLRIRKDNCCPTLTTRGSGSFSGYPIVNQNGNTRFISQKEQWRFMSFKDEDYYSAKSVSNKSDLSKQAGNSIVKNVLVAIFGQMLEGKENIYKGVD